MDFSQEEFDEILNILGYKNYVSVFTPSGVINL